MCVWNRLSGPGYGPLLERQHEGGACGRQWLPVRTGDLDFQRDGLLPRANRRTTSSEMLLGREMPVMLSQQVVFNEDVADWARAVTSIGLQLRRYTKIYRTWEKVGQVMLLRFCGQKRCCIKWK